MWIIDVIWVTLHSVACLRAVGIGHDVVDCHRLAVRKLGMVDAVQHELELVVEVGSAI